MAKKILLADDSVTIQKVVSITLAHEDFDLVIVDNGAKAVAKAKEVRPDVILLDVMMPDKDGYQVCQEIKATSELSNIPIILLTGTFEPFDADRAAEVGADDFIKKPFESHTLINKVKVMAAKRGVGRERPVDIGGVDIGFETPREAEFGEQAVGAQRGAHQADLETPWEDELIGDKKGASKEGEAEDIWSVEEFEDIAGAKPGKKPGAVAVEQPAPGRDMRGMDRPAPETISRERGGLKKDVSDEFFGHEEPARDVGGEGFELGEEISEDELEKFLEEEGGEAEIDAGDRTEEAQDLLGEESVERLFASDETKVPRARGEEFGGLDEELLIDDTAVEEPIDIEWEEKPRAGTGKVPVEEKAGREFESLIRRTSEEELADFSEYGDEFSESEGRPKTKEFDVDTSSFEEGESDEFIFEEVSEEGADDRGPARDTATKEDAEGFPRKEDIPQAVSKIAREVIERVVWEVVPELAEELIKQEIKRLKGEKA